MDATGSRMVRGERTGASPVQLDRLSDMAWSVLGVIAACGAVSRETLLSLYGLPPTSCTALDTALQVLKGVPPDRRRNGKGTWVDIRPSSCLAFGCQRAGKVTRVQVVHRPGGPTRVNLEHAQPEGGVSARVCRRYYVGRQCEAFSAWLDARRLEPAPPQYVRATALDGRHAVYVATSHGVAQVVARAFEDGIVASCVERPAVEPAWALPAQALVGEAVALAIEAAGCQEEPWRLPVRQLPGGAPVVWRRDAGKPDVATRADPPRSTSPFSVMVLPGRALWLLPIPAALGRTWWDGRSLESLAAEVEHFERYAMTVDAAALRSHLEALTGQADALLRLVLVTPDADRKAAFEVLKACPSMRADSSRLVTLAYTPRELADYLVDRLRLPRVPPRVPRRSAAEGRQPPL